MVQGRVSDTGRDRDADGRARNARARDHLGRPLDTRAAPEPDPPVPAPEDALATAQELLDTGQPFAAHEVLEAVWKASATNERELWRGLAQLAVGITHAMRDNPVGARSLLHRAAESLAPYAGRSPYDVDVDGLRDWATGAADDLSRAAAAPRLVRPADRG
jgi:hypothetical protein